MKIRHLPALLSRSTLVHASAAAALALAGAALAQPVASSAATTSTTTTGPIGPSGSWVSTFDDEFNGTTLDTTKWAPNRYGYDYGGDTPFNPSAEDAWFGSGNVSVSNGNLALTIKSEPKTLSGKTYPYSSGVVQSAQHFLMKPGSYVEARISVPKCDGCWPAFWTVSPNTWPPELDIFEFFGTQNADQSRPFFNYHPPAGGQTGPRAYGASTTDFRGTFHTYGMLWDGTKAIPYVDGVAYPGATSSMTSLSQELILNLSVQAGHKPAAGSQMLVDWLRVWQPGTAVSSAPAASSATPTPTATATPQPTTTATPKPTATASGTPKPTATASAAPTITTTTTVYSQKNIELSPSTASSLVLDVQGASTQAGAHVIAWTRNNGANQRWNVTARPDGSHLIINFNSGQCLTSDGVAGHTLYQSPCTSAAGQLWRGDLTPGTSAHTIANATTGLRVDVFGGSTAAGAAIDAWSANGNGNQAFLATQR